MTILEQLEGLVSAKIGVFKSIFSLIKLETRLAGLSIFPLLLTLGMLLIVLFGVWTTSMCALGIGIYNLVHHLLLSVGLVLLVNVVMLLGLLKYLQFTLKNLSFAKTRAYFSQKEGADYEQLQSTTNGANCANE